MAAAFVAAPRADLAGAPLGVVAARAQTNDANAALAPETEGAPQDLSGRLAGASVRFHGEDVEIVFDDGKMIAINGGYYTQIDVDGTIKVDRIATAKDRARVAALAREMSAAIGVATGSARRIERINGDLAVTFADGTRQIISGDVFEQRNADGGVVVNRPASVEDRQRLEETAQRLNPSRDFGLNPDGVISIVVEDDTIVVMFDNGYVEKIEDGVWRLLDPEGVEISERKATPEDRARLDSFYKK